MKYFWYLPKKSKFSFYFFRRGEKLNFFHSYFSLILPGSAGLVGIILAYNVILMTGYKEICGFRKLLEAAVGLTSRAN